MQRISWGKILFLWVVFALATYGAVWGSGFFFFLLSRSNPLGETDIWTWLNYWRHYQADPTIALRLKKAAILAAVVSYSVPFSLVIAAVRKKRSLHGEARFATTSEVRRSGLLGTQHGIIVGQWMDQYLMLGGQQFVLLAAPTRSGKGVGIVIPNLLNFADSCVVLDIKQENFNLTAGFRAKHGQKVYLFNPFSEDLRTHRYNPLGYVREGNFRVGDILAIAKVFYPGDGKDPFFDDQAQNLFLGLALYLCETPSLPRTIGEMLRQSSGKGQPLRNYLQKIVKARNPGEPEEAVSQQPSKSKRLPPLSMACIDALNRFMNTSDNTLTSILATFNAPLTIWANPIVDAATSENDFDLREVRRKRITIYVGITPDHLQEAGRLVNLFFSQLVNLNTKALPENSPDLKYQCLLLLDEFTSMGKVGIIAKAVAYLAAYNLRLLPIIQSISQLTSAYGPEDARNFMTNHALHILYAPREQKDANEYSEMLGYETVKSTSKSRQRGGTSESVSDQRRALLLPQEIKEIGQWKEIIILENTKPILCDKIKYFADPLFKKRLLPAPVVELLDLDTHQAIMLQSRTRSMTLEDVKQGIDLNKLALDFSKIPELDEDNLDPGAIEAFVNGFFDAIEAEAGEAVIQEPPVFDLSVLSSTTAADSLQINPEAESRFEQAQIS